MVNTKKNYNYISVNFLFKRTRMSTMGTPIIKYSQCTMSGHMCFEGF